jgi:hypothetical protein
MNQVYCHSGLVQYLSLLNDAMCKRYSFVARRPIETPFLALLLDDGTRWSQDARVSSSCRPLPDLSPVYLSRRTSGRDSWRIVMRHWMAVRHLVFTLLWTLRFRSLFVSVEFLVRHSTYTCVARLHVPMFWSNSRSSDGFRSICTVHVSMS